MKKPVAVIRHIGVEGLGTIEDVLKRSGRAYGYIDMWKDTLPQGVSDYSAIIVLGGPMGVYERDRYPFIEKELSLIRKARDGRLPVIGICLGSQMIAQAMGGRVYKGRAKEIGWCGVRLTQEASEDRLFAEVGPARDGPGAIRVFQWHGDTFDLPDDAVVLASSELYPNQAFRIGNIYGLQFHIEVKEADIRNWLNEYKAELDTLRSSINISKILDDTRIYIDQLNKTCIRIFSAFFSFL